MTSTATPAGSRAVQRAQARRNRRQARMTPDRVARAGRPVRSALLRVPFVAALIVVLGSGIGAVLYLNTATGESGMRSVKAQQDSAVLRQQIEALTRAIADDNSTPRIAAQAHALGLVPAGDAAILVIDPSGAGTLVGAGAPTGAATPTGGGR